VGFLTALLAGASFGTGLLLSGMYDPQRVLAFLDVAGRWNPSLAFTMLGAIIVASPAFWYVRTRKQDLLHRPVELPDRVKIDRPLLLGSGLFGIGWGLSGICPGPSLLLLTGLTLPAFIFVVGVIAGLLAVRLLPGRPRTSSRGNTSGQHP
jgi:uncharacterized membrane protein YedE/YeeE